MKPTNRLASTHAPDGTELVLLEHDGQYSIRAGGLDLMTSRQHASEIELARLGCARLIQNRNAVVLIGGLGMGYTLRAALDMLVPQAKIVVAELLPAIVRWNRDVLGKLTEHPLRDKRVTVKTEDVLDVIRASGTPFDAILLDVDNGPDAMVDRDNKRLYSREGVRTCCEALHEKGVLSVWSAAPDKGYERRLQQQGMHVRRFRVPSYLGSRNQFHYIWTASANRQSLPEGGGEPYPLQGGRSGDDGPPTSRRAPRHRRA